MEGSAEILFDDQVFYNPIQQFNRDLSIAAIKVWSQIYFEEQNQKKNKTGLPRVESELTLFPQVVNDIEKTKQQKRLETQIHAMQEFALQNNYSPVDMDSVEAKQHSFTILEALSATGLRSIRYAKEIPNVTKIVSNDLSSKAVESIRKNALFNSVESIIEPNEGDACQVLYQALGNQKQYHVIDLDPYGSAAPFLDAAVQAVADGGLLCVTCTDLAVLAGSQTEACWAKYGGINIPNAAFTHEMVIVLFDCRHFVFCYTLFNPLHHVTSEPLNH
jgi:tRNA (guanine26-N2/guanine27-N2)-dimethyltransferase